MAVFLLLTFTFALQTSLYYSDAMPTVGVTRNITMPTNCIGKTYCTENIGYPQEEVNDLLQNQDSLQFRISVNPNDLLPEIVNREGTDDEIKNPCEEENDYGYIHYIVDEYDNLRIVVQSEGRLTQYHPITRCESSKPAVENGVVNELKQHLECRENILYFNYMVLSLDFKSIEMATVKGGVPVGCRCIFVEK